MSHKVKPQFYATDRQHWQNWLKTNHAKLSEIWLVFYKKHLNKPGVNYMDSVEEAICFGWIDGLKKSIDEEKYAYRFTPRKTTSKWSLTNIALAKKMIKAGSMENAGLKAFNERKVYDQEFLKSKTSNAVKLSLEIEKALKANKTAWNNFNNLTPGYKKQYVTWLMSAKRQETKDKRIKEAKKLLLANKKLGMK